MFKVIKFLFWSLVVAVIVVAAYTYRMDDGLTVYQHGYRMVTGELPQIDKVTSADRQSLNNLVEKTVKARKK